MKLKLGVVGYGGFSRDFVQLFNKHPDVESLSVAELYEERRADIKKDFPNATIYTSYDEMLENADNINCVAIFTQRHLHADMVKKALKAGKHVYSAVPIACTVEDVKDIVELVKETKLVYMMGETCYYYPDAILCREKYKNGDFGKFVYAEAQYYHDIREMHGVFQRSGGDSWRRVAGIPPMFYPTHSISTVFAAINQYATKVSCMGLRDDFPDDIFGEEKNDFENPFSNETAIFRMSGGGVVRINEFRRVGINKPSTYITCFYGEQGSYDRVVDKAYFQKAPYIERNGTEPQLLLEDVSEKILPTRYKDFRDGKIDFGMRGNPWDDNKTPADIDLIMGDTEMLDFNRLPKSFRNHQSWNNPASMSHFTSHPFLVDDFVRAVVENKLPPNNAWDSARYMIPGLIAHESALRGGELMDIPDLGDAPAEFERLTYIKKDYYEND